MLTESTVNQNNIHDLHWSFCNVLIELYEKSDQVRTTQITIFYNCTYICVIIYSFEGVKMYCMRLNGRYDVFFIYFYMKRKFTFNDFHVIIIIFF